MKAAPLSTLDTKLQWLRDHRQLWEGYERNDARKRLLVEKMKRDGLISKNTYWKDVNLLGLLIRIQER